MAVVFLLFWSRVFRSGSCALEKNIIGLGFCFVHCVRRDVVSMAAAIVAIRTHHSSSISEPDTRQCSSHPTRFVSIVVHENRASGRPGAVGPQQRSFVDCSTRGSATGSKSGRLWARFVCIRKATTRLCLLSGGAEWAKATQGLAWGPLIWRRRLVQRAAAQRGNGWGPRAWAL